MNDPILPARIDPVGLTRQLCEIESTTYHEGAVGDFLADFLAGQGWQVEKTPVPQPLESATAGARWNVYAGIAGQTPDLVFSTHMDTVPPYIPFSEDAEFMYGRGVSDAKGIIAAQVAAAQALRAEGFRVGVLFVSGEERDSAGAKVANLAPKGSRFLINGEPTDNRLALASKGALRAVFKASGKMAHSAYPELGESAVHKLVEVLGRLLEIPLPSLEDVGPSTLNIGQIHGGHAPNVIADKAEAQVLVRLVGDSAPVRAALVEACAGLAEVDFTLEIPFVRLRAVEGLPTMIAKFTTDIPQLSNWGEPLLLGPGSIHVAHTPHERLAKKELLEAVELYIQVAKQLLSWILTLRKFSVETFIMPASIYEIPVAKITGEPASLAEFKGDVLLIVNTASQCVFTPQYEGLEKLYDRFRERGFVVVGFPANDFKEQEPGTNDEIHSFCTLTYGVKFPMFGKITVVGDDKHPLYAALIAAQADAISVGGNPFRQQLKGWGVPTTEEPEISWNFEKFIVSRSGEVVKRFAPETAPDAPELVAAIEAELVKS